MTLHHRLKPIVLLVITSSILVGCIRDQAVDDLKEYQQRLANILEVDFEWSEPQTSLSYPAINQLKVPVPEASINLRDFYALQECAVGTLIAQRNTALGKAQLQSTRYFYEVQLIDGLKECLQSVKNEQIERQLESWIEQKDVALPMVWANLIQTSQEIIQAFSSNQSYLDPDHNNLVEFSLALEYLIELPNRNNANITKIENSLNVLRETAVAAELWKTQRLMTIELTNATNMLKQHTADFTCESTSEKQTTNYLNNVFKKYFIERIQPLAGSIDKSHYALEPVFEKLLLSEHLRPLFKDHIEQELSKYNQYRGAIQQHIMHWQGLFKRCSIAPNQ